MNDLQFIESANKFAKANPKKSSIEIQQTYNNNLIYLSRPEEQVVVIRKTWQISRWNGGSVVQIEKSLIHLFTNEY